MGGSEGGSDGNGGMVKEDVTEAERMVGEKRTEIASMHKMVAMEEKRISERRM